jgi:hypothetical protein
MSKTIERLEDIAWSFGKMRVGRTLGRTLYAADHFIGMVDTPEAARAIVDAMNALPALLAVVKAAKAMAEAGDFAHGYKLDATMLEALEALEEVST